MCRWFSFVVDQEGCMYYFGAQHRKLGLLGSMWKKPGERGQRSMWYDERDLDSHSAICSFHGLGCDEVDKWEYDPRTRRLKLDSMHWYPYATPRFRDGGSLEWVLARMRDEMYPQGLRGFFEKCKKPLKKKKFEEVAWGLPVELLRKATMKVRPKEFAVMREGVEKYGDSALAWLLPPQYGSAELRGTECWKINMRLARQGVAVYRNPRWDYHSGIWVRAIGRDWRVRRTKG